MKIGVSWYIWVCKPFEGFFTKIEESSIEYQAVLRKHGYIDQLAGLSAAVIHRERTGSEHTILQKTNNCLQSDPSRV